MTTLVPTIDQALAIARAHHAAGRVDDAAANMEAAVAASPTDPDGLAALAHLRLEQARTAEAVQLLGIVAGMTRDRGAWAEWLYYGQHDGATTPELMCQYAGHFRWGGPPPKTYDGRRRLRVAYLSAHLRNHATARFVLPLLRGHSDAVEVCGYHDGVTDDTTARVKALCTHWRNIRPLHDAQVDQAIRSDGIDVLIDLDGIMPGARRQAVVASRPAPVMASYLGYGMTSGFPFVYRITDGVMDPTDAPNLIRLPGCCYAFEPRDVPAHDAPVERNGYVTFGSLNRVCKITPGVARAWGRILAEVPDARLIVLAPGGEMNGSVRGMLETAGVDGSRLALRAKGDQAVFGAVMGEVDVGLSPWPYSAHAVACDSLAAGVPVVTLARPDTSPAAASLLTACGFSEGVATTEDEYARIAVEMARSPALAWRAERRSLAAPLGDGRRVAAALEEKLIELSKV